MKVVCLFVSLLVVALVAADFEDSNVIDLSILWDEPEGSGEPTEEPTEITTAEPGTTTTSAPSTRPAPTTIPIAEPTTKKPTTKEATTKKPTTKKPTTIKPTTKKPTTKKPTTKKPTTKKPTTKKPTTKKPTTKKPTTKKPTTRRPTPSRFQRCKHSYGRCVRRLECHFLCGMCFKACMKEGHFKCYKPTIKRCYREYIECVRKEPWYKKFKCFFSFERCKHFVEYVDARCRHEHHHG